MALTGVAVTALSVLGQLDAKDAIGLLGVGMFCLALGQFRK